MAFEAAEKNLLHVELLRCLDWNPDTGRFTWRIDMSQRVKAGDPAGLITPDGRYVLTLHGKRYYGHRLAYFYAEGEWPIGEPRFRDFDRSNCSVHNLYFVPKTYSSEPSAVASRKANQKRRQRARLYDRASPIPGIVKTIKGDWIVYHPAEIPEEGVYRVVIGRERSFAAASLLYYARLRGYDFVVDHPVATPAFEDLHTLAGPPGSINLAEAREYLAYDPEAGIFYRRQRHTNRLKINRRLDHLSIKGARADELNTNGTPVINFFGRDYSAASLAVFMQRGFWPERRSVRFKDGDKRNLAWSNLQFEEPSRG